MNYCIVYRSTKERICLQRLEVQLPICMLQPNSRHDPTPPFKLFFAKSAQHRPFVSRAACLSKRVILRGRQAFPVTPEVATAAEAEAPWPLHGVILRSTLLRMLAHQLGLNPGDASADGSAAGLQHAAAYSEASVLCLHRGHHQIALLSPLTPFLSSTCRRTVSLSPYRKFSAEIPRVHEIQRP